MLNKAIAVALAAATGLLASAAVAQDYPTRPVTVIVPYAPGGPADIMARLVGEKLTQRLGQQFTVENRSGGSGIPALEAALAAPADGYTIVMGHDGNLAANVSLFASLPYDPVADFEPITLLAQSSVVLVTNPGLGFTNVDDLITYAKAHPGELNYASAGIGSGGHFAASRFAAITGVDMVHIPYDGGAPAALAVVANQSQLVFQSPSAALPYVQSGQLTALGVAGPERSAQLPDVPTMIEAGVEFSQISWYGLLVRSGTPEEITDKLNAEITAILAEPDVVATLQERGLTVTPSTRQAFADFIVSETELWKEAVDLAGIEVQ